MNKLNTMDPEKTKHLLVELLKLGAEEKTISIITRLTTDEWLQLIDVSRKHGITPLIYNHLHQTKIFDLIPQSIQEQLRKIYLFNAARNTKQYHELIRLVNLLQNYHIPVILLKGAHLGEIIFNNIALRPMADLDILVQKADLEKSVHLVMDHGYCFVDPRIEKIWVQNQFKNIEILSNSKHFPDLLHHEKDIRLDVHCSIVPKESPFSVNMDDIWRRAEQINIQDIKTRVLEMEDLILYLSIHTAYLHQFRAGLRDLCDILQIVKVYQKEIQWEIIECRVKEWKATRCVYITLVLTRELFNTEIPETLLRHIEPEDYNKSILIQAQDALFQFPDSFPNESMVFIRFWNTRYFHHKIKLFIHSLFPPRQVMARMYPPSPDSPEIFLYYPVRFLHLLFRYTRTVLHRIFQRQSSSASLKQQISLEDWMRSG